MTIERGSDKMGSRIDDELAQETESLQRGAPVSSRAEEFREQEGPGDDEPTPDARLAGDRDLTPEDSLTPDEVEARSEIARHLEPSAFPADRAALLDAAREQDATGGVIAALESLPPDRRFENVQQVWEALGGRTEKRA